MWKHTVFSVDSNKIITWLVYPLVGWGRGRNPVYLHPRSYILMPPAHPFTKLSTICSIALRRYLSSSGFDDCCRIFLFWLSNMKWILLILIQNSSKSTKNYLLFDVSTSVRGLHQRSKRQKVNNFLVGFDEFCMFNSTKWNFSQWSLLDSWWATA